MCLWEYPCCNALVLWMKWVSHILCLRLRKTYKPSIHLAVLKMKLISNRIMNFHCNISNLIYFLRMYQMCVCVFPVSMIDFNYLRITLVFYLCLSLYQVKFLRALNTADTQEGLLCSINCWPLVYRSSLTWFLEIARVCLSQSRVVWVVQCHTWTRFMRVSLKCPEVSEWMSSWRLLLYSDKKTATLQYTCLQHHTSVCSELLPATAQAVIESPRKTVNLPTLFCQ